MDRKQKLLIASMPVTAAFLVAASYVALVPGAVQSVYDGFARAASRTSIAQSLYKAYGKTVPTISLIGDYKDIINREHAIVAISGSALPFQVARHLHSINPNQNLFVTSCRGFDKECEKFFDLGDPLVHIDYIAEHTTGNAQAIAEWWSNNRQIKKLIVVAADEHKQRLTMELRRFLPPGSFWILNVDANILKVLFNEEQLEVLQRQAPYYFENSENNEPGKFFVMNLLHAVGINVDDYEKGLPELQEASLR